MVAAGLTTEQQEAFNVAVGAVLDSIPEETMASILTTAGTDVALLLENTVVVAALTSAGVSAETMASISAEIPDAINDIIDGASAADTVASSSLFLTVLVSAATAGTMLF